MNYAENAHGVNALFPVTLWPKGPLPEPAVDPTGQLIRVEGARLPVDWILRQLVDADLDNDSALDTLMREFGRIRRRFSTAFWDLLPGGASERMAQGEMSFTIDAFGDFDTSGTMEDARWWLKATRALVGTWREAALGKPIVPAWTAEGFSLTMPHGQIVVPSWSPRDRAVRDVELGKTDDHYAWLLFKGFLNEGLRPLSARVSLIDDAPPLVDLFTGACVQIYNLIAGGDCVRICEFEPCGRAFVRQFGAAKVGQFRSDARFCSVKCGNAQRARDRRRRLAEAKRQAVD